MMGFQRLARKLFGTQNDRELKSIQPLVGRVNALEEKTRALSDAELVAKTPAFKQRVANGEPIDDLLPEAFAVVREAARRTLGQRHYDVQLVGGITLHKGRIAEMKTGEGKTLVGTLPVYLNALAGEGVHVVTVNDYLARRDSEWMGRIYKFLGLSVGVVVHGISDRQRQENYRCDITYGQNNEFGFDYLRDNMKFRLSDYVQRKLHYAIVDEVDSILIDEARTPLIISGPSEESTDLYATIDAKIRGDGGLVKDEDYTIDEKSKTASLSEKGVEKMERRLSIENLYDPNNIEVLHHVNQALRANVLFKRDVDYVVKDGEVVIVDEFTGRMMPGRRWSDGLHQAIEAKEGVTVESENQTLATITFQNYFRMYKKLAGMTGTADTEATEFQQIYKLDVTVIPTNRPVSRSDNADLIYKSEEAKYNAILAEVKELHEKKQPMLVGTISVEKSEKIAALLKREGIPHNVLNAKNHFREAEIVAQAGRKGAVTIATNMAGRGTDIMLGGNPEGMAKAQVGTLERDATDEEKAAHSKLFEETLATYRERCEKEKDEVRAVGGLFILGTERHESRRIDNQLRGRSGRQGDPGGSRFYLSLDDDLMRIFGGVNIKRFMEDDLPIEHRWITKAIENAQKKVEAHNYDIRKHLLKYDDVMNSQRNVVYTWRRAVLERDNLREMLFSMVDELAAVVANDFFPGGKLKKEDGQRSLNLHELNDAIRVTFQISSSIQERDINPFNDKGLRDLIVKMCSAHYDAKEKEIGPATLRDIERMVLLTTIDHLWKEHLLAMDHLREGIGLRGYAQKDPLIEYKKEGFRFFEMMMNIITGDVVRKLMAVQMAADERFEAPEPRRSAPSMRYNLSSDGSLVPQPGLPSAAPIPGAMPPGGPGLMAGAGGGMDILAGGRGGPRGPMRGGPGGPRMGGPSAAPQAQAAQARPVQNRDDKVGRNDPCPCGSGKKYKKCHGS